MFRCPFFMQLRGGKMILPFASVYPKLSCRGSRLDRCGFLFLLGDLQVFLSHIKLVFALSLACPETTRGNAELPQLAPTPQFLQMSKLLLLSLRLNTTIQRKLITASCIFLLYFMPRGERWNTQMTK